MTRDHTYHPLRVARVVAETADSCSFVFDVPEELRSTFTYEPGQFCDVRVQVDGEPLIRCYSMSSSAAIGEPLQVTVKRVADGIVSNWMIDQISEDDFVEVAAPAGFFQLAGESDLVAFGAGSGITPIFSLLKTALARTSRHIRLLYANRDRDSVIFGAAIDALAEEHGDRFEVTHRLDVEHGFVDAEVVRSVIADARDPEFYICGPAPFMDIVEHTLLADGVDAGRIHIARPAGCSGDGDRECDSQWHTRHHRAGRPHRCRRPPPGHHDPANRTTTRHVTAVLVRVGQLRDMHGAHRRRQRIDAREQRAHP
jgi:3-ketosteroid 9alpha-monooxygenase subunit B